MKTINPHLRLRTVLFLTAMLCFAWQCDSSSAQSIMDYFQSAEAKSARGDHEGAISDLNRIIAIDPEIASAFERRGTEYAYLQKSKEAYDDYSHAIKLNPQGYSAYSNRGKLLSDGGHHEMALTDYDMAIALAPNDAIAYGNRGSTKSLMGRLEEALLDCTHAIQLNPEFANFYNTRGATYFRMKQYHQALADFTKARELDPQDTVYYYNIGLIRQMSNDMEGAIEDFDKAITIQPPHTKAYAYRAFSRYALQDWTAALNDFRQYAKLLPDESFNDTVQHFIWLTRLRSLQNNPNSEAVSQEKEAATAEMRRYFFDKKRDGESGWTHSVAAFLLGDLSREQLFSAARTDEEETTQAQLAEAAFHAGTKSLIENDIPNAIKLLQQCADAKQHLTETHLAAAELKRLKPTPAE